MTAVGESGTDTKAISTNTGKQNKVHMILKYTFLAEIF